MQNAYQLQSPVAQRASQPFGLIPPGSILANSLHHQSLSFSQFTQGFGINAMTNDQNSSNPIPESSRIVSPERSLPSRDVNDEALDDAYVQFALYCNPAIPDTVDPFELKRGFRSPPKSDGKSFSTFDLYNLIRRLERKDIKTWSQVVIELGVELPDTSKNQSTQKVQQYAVRLKRWLHAYHIDAFFQYLIGIPNSYYTEVPSTEENPSEIQYLRDGVPPEEDLVIRALLPEWRPKRGRRKAEDADIEATVSDQRTLQQRSDSVDVAHAFDEQFSTHQRDTPWSAQPQEHDAWAAAQVAIAPKTPITGRTPSGGQLSADLGGQQFKFRVNLGDRATPATPHPQSAIQLQQKLPTTPLAEEPRSAEPISSVKSPLRSRKRHGPAVSSAWQGSNSGANGKLRGRPPGNRSVKDGPYSTFPANPSTKEAPTINIGTPVSANNSSQRGRQEAPISESSSAFQQIGNAANCQTLGLSGSEQAAARKPNKLQLQVPEHAGGPVRLATPPTLLINGEGRLMHERSSSADFFGSLYEGSDEGPDDDPEEATNIDWKKRAMVLKRRLQDKDDELKAIKRRVLDAVM